MRKTIVMLRDKILPSAGLVGLPPQEGSSMFRPSSETITLRKGEHVEVDVLSDQTHQFVSVEKQIEFGLEEGDYEDAPQKA